MRSIGPAVTREPSPAFLRNSNGRLDFPGPTQEASWIPRRNSSSFPDSSVGKESAWVWSLGWVDPWIETIPWRKERLPTPVFWPGEFHGLNSQWGRKELDATEWLSLSLFLACICCIWFLSSNFLLFPSLFAQELLFQEAFSGSSKQVPSLWFLPKHHELLPSHFALSHSILFVCFPF